MKTEVFLSYFLSDPLIGSFFLRGDYLSDHDESDKISDAGGDTEHELEVLWSEASASYDEEKISNRMSSIQSRWKKDYQSKEAFLLFFIDLISTKVGRDIIYELKRLDKSIEPERKKEFYLLFIEYLSDEKKIKSCIEKLATPRHAFFDDQSMEYQNKKEANTKSLTKLVNKVFPEIRSFIENSFLKPKFSYNLERVDSNEGQVPHPFIWCGDNTELAQLVLFLAAKDWMIINPRIMTKKNLAIAISNIFLIKDGGSLKNISPSTFESYFKGLELEDINTMVVDEVYALKDKMKATTSSPFKHIVPNE